MPGWQAERASVPVLARGGQAHPTPDLARAWMTSPKKAGTGCSPHALQDRRPAYPAAYPLVTLILILPGCASSICSSCPGSVAADAGPPTCATTTTSGVRRGPRRGPGSAAGHPPATADAGALARRRLAAFPYPDQRRPAASRSAAPTRARAQEAGRKILDHHSQPCLRPSHYCTAPSEIPGRPIRDLRPIRSGRADAARATTRHPVLRAGAPAVLHRSAAGAAAPARRGRRGPRPCSVATPGRRGWHYGGCHTPAWHRRSCRAESGKAPPCMRWRGLTRPGRARGQLAGLADAARRPPGPGTRASRPVSRLLPRSRGQPQVVPVSNGERIIIASPNAAQGPAASHFRISAIHTVSTERGQLSAFGGGYPPAYSQLVHRLCPGITRGTPRPPAACNRLIFSQRLAGNHLVP